MGTFRSNLPLGTSDASVFIEGNVPNLDEALNSQEVSWIDRFGRQRITFRGVEVSAQQLLDAIGIQWDSLEEDIRQKILEMGFSEVPYVAGEQIEALTQYIIAPNGQAYAINPDIPLPYTITGDWNTEQSNFRLVGDTALRGELASPSGASLVGYRNSTIDGVFNGTMPFGPDTVRVDGSYGPFISRSWSTIEPIDLFVDPSIGNDMNPGSISLPLKTITAALQKLPQNIYHRVRIYLLDGDYGDERISLFNHYLTARGTSLSIIGHVARGGGAAHPIYTDDKPENVIIGGSEHVISGLSGSEEFSFSGITFKNGWIESYDSYVSIENCIMDGGQNPPSGYASRHAFGGHYSTLHVKNTAIKNVAAIMASTNGSTAIFENCTLENLISESSASTKGIPFSVSVGCKVIVRSSPTLLADGPNGRSLVSGELISLSEYSNGGYSVINRANPKNDESVSIVSHDRAGLTSGLGSGIALYGINHPQKPGNMEFVFGGGNNARTIFRFQHNSPGLPSGDVLTLDRTGDVDANGALGFKQNKRNVSDSLVNDGDACLYTNPATGNVFVACKKDGVVKYAKILDFATATPL